MNSSSAHRYAGAAAMVAAAACCLLVFLTFINNPPFSTDSWSYFELSKTIFSDFYRINTWRQYQFPGEYGVSFPPLWPFLMALFNLAFNAGIYAGFILNLFIGLITLLLLSKLSGLLFRSVLPGVLLYLSLLNNTAYITELPGGRSIPLATLLIVAILYVFLKEDTVDSKRVMLIGFLSGLAALARFDFLLAGFTLGIITCFYARGNYPKAFIRYYVLYFTALSPWIIYSLSHFSKIWVSDNLRTVSASIHTYVNDYYTHPIPAFSDEPVKWLTKTAANFQYIYEALGEMIYSDVIAIAVIVIFVSTLVLSRLKTTLRKQEESVGRLAFKKITSFGLVFIVLIGGVALTGYAEERYFCSAVLFLKILFLYGAYYNLKTNFPRKDIALSALYVIGISYLVILTSINYYKNLPESYSFNKSDLSPLEFKEILACMDDHTEKRILFARFSKSVYKFGALTGIKTFGPPRNLAADNVKQFISQYGINYIAINKTEAIGSAGDSISYIIRNDYKYDTPCDLEIYRIYQ